MLTHVNWPVRWMVRRLIAVVVVFGAAVPATAAALDDGAADTADSISLRSALVLPRVGTGGRRPVHLDALEAAIVAGAWASPRAGDSVTLPDGASAEWFEAEVDDGGWIRPPELRGGYAYWSVDLPAPRTMLLHASGHSMVYVNGAPRAGDPYRNGWGRLPVALRAGRNDILFHCPRGGVRATLVPPPAPMFIEVREATLPNVLRSEPWAVHGGVVVVNATDGWGDDLVLRSGGDILPVRETRIGAVPPMSLRKVPFWLGGAVPADVDTLTMSLELVRDDAGGVRRVMHTTETRIAVRDDDERHTRTFVSAIDGSVQYYATVPMRRDASRLKPDDAPALFLTLHGASVEGSRQAAVYAPKSWGHVVAPTNRRPFGFDWEDWGRLDALEVLADAERRLGTDPARTYLTGHSMGGHGTWHLGVTFPDRWAAIAPSAGWRSFTSYTGAERFASMEGIAAVLKRATNSSDTESLSRNYLHHGIYILHGDADTNVPVDQARYMKEHLAPFHADVAYHEQPGAGHWWGDQCCDWPPIFSFFETHRRPLSREVDHVEFHTANPGVSSRSHWMKIEQQLVPLEFSHVVVDVDRAARTYSAQTTNVARMAIDLEALAPGEPVSLDVDGVRLTDVAWPEGAARINLRRSASAGGASWSVTDVPLPAGEKGPHRYGPFKDAFRHDMVFVYGTGGTDDENAWAYAKARFDAETFWYRGNGGVEVIPDHRFDVTAEPDRSVILYGHADAHGSWKALLGDSPVDVRRGHVRIGSRRLDADDLACLLIRPRPGSDVASVAVVGGSGLAGMRLTDRLPYFVSGIGYPDYLVMSPRVLSEGLEGIAEGGYFDLDWGLSGD